MITCRWWWWWRGGTLFGLSQFLVMSYEVRFYQTWCLGPGTCLSSAGLFHVVALFDFFPCHIYFACQWVAPFPWTNYTCYNYYGIWYWCVMEFAQYYYCFHYFLYVSSLFTLCLIIANDGEIRENLRKFLHPLKTHSCMAYVSFVSHYVLLQVWDLRLKKEIFSISENTDFISDMISNTDRQTLLCAR